VKSENENTAYKMSEQKYMQRSLAANYVNGRHRM